MGAKTSRSARRRLSPASVGALATLFVLGLTVAAVVGPALADISPPTTTIPTTTSGPSPDPAPKQTTTTAPKKAPAPKPQSTTSKPAPPPAPVHTSTPVSQPAPTSTPPVSSPSVHRVIKKTVKPVHRAKAKAKPAHKARRHLRPVTKPPLKPHGVLGAQATKHAAPTTRVASPALSGSDSSSSALRHALIILLFGLPALVLGAALVPPHAVPHRMALVWRNSRLNVGLLAASVLLVEALLYMLTS